MAAIGRFRSDLSITRKTDGNFEVKLFRGCFVFQSRVSTKTVVIHLTGLNRISTYHKSLEKTTNRLALVAVQTISENYT